MKNVTYELVAKRSVYSKRPNVVLWSDDDREKVIRRMKEYDEKHGFTVDDVDGKTPIGTLILREITLTGEIISETKWHEIFDAYGERRDKKDERESVMRGRERKRKEEWKE